MADRFHEANRRRWDVGSASWAYRADTRGIWKRCHRDPSLALHPAELKWLCHIAGKRVAVLGSGDNPVNWLFALFGRYASATYMFYHVSGEAVVWAIVGGAGTLLGPLVGTAIFIVVREIVSTHWEHHSLVVGAVAILVVIFAPKGVVGLWREWLALLTESDATASVEVALRTEP